MIWLRWWVGTANDPKWRIVAMRAQCRAGDCLAVWAYLLEVAKEGEGDITAADIEECSVVLGFQLDVVTSIIAAMKDKGLIDGSRLSSWEKRQPKREDDSTSRVAAFRDRKKNSVQDQASNTRNAPVTQCNAPESESESESERKVVSEPSVSDPPPVELEKPKRTKRAYSDDFEAFWRAYPTDPLMSKAEAGKAWARLSVEDRGSASSAVPAFRDRCAKDPTYRPLHACRFLSQRRFEGFAAAQSTGPPVAGVPQFTSDAEFDAWWQSRQSAAIQ